MAEIIPGKNSPFKEREIMFTKIKNLREDITDHITPCKGQMYSIKLTR